MSRVASGKSRGYFGIGIERAKTEVNVGTLIRTAGILGAAYVFVIGPRYKHQATDTMKAYRNMPLLQFPNFEAFSACRPYDAPLIGVELTDKAVPLHSFYHPERAVYLLGAEDSGLSPTAIRACTRLVRLPGERSMNVSVAGSIVLYDRVTRGTSHIGRTMKEAS